MAGDSQAGKGYFDGILTRLALWEKEHKNEQTGCGKSLNL